jgi:hypothetical protein
MGFRTLHVINEDLRGSGPGIRNTRHRDMEILTYVLQGSRSQRRKRAAANLSQLVQSQKLGELFACRLNVRPDAPSTDARTGP